MKFFVDVCISHKLVNALMIISEGCDYEIEHHSLRFRGDIRDEEWIGILATEGGWIIISGDPRISRGKAERKAWQESGLTAFFFSDGWSSKNVWKQAEDLFYWWPKIVQQARECEEGSGYYMPVNGKNFKPIYT